MDKMAISAHLLIITLNINGLNISIKRHTVTEWTHKKDPFICCTQEAYFRYKDTHRLKMKGWIKILHANGKNKIGGAKLISDKLGFLKETPTRNKEGHYIMIKGITPTRKYNIYKSKKYTCTQHRNTYIHEADINREKGWNWQ